ncbi:hypothetical protein SERLA73DRAFT_149300 [Serpula lacrymans var. lacrymans S7.3]|uniref:Uncharacterized protein n=1 Tax=Serpula lacrymans var. lacrymans (strain S7.3) TaxID=936435 RepID=F8PHL8_SERL3|nr:hypothetical protein SERLA73DRAFT_149300 [Serpula lacrymans var. lacrymans S7.3]
MSCLVAVSIILLLYLCHFPFLLSTPISACAEGKKDKLGNAWRITLSIKLTNLASSSSSWVCHSGVWGDEDLKIDIGLGDYLFFQRVCNLLQDYQQNHGKLTHPLKLNSSGNVEFEPSKWLDKHVSRHLISWTESQ